MRDLRPRWQRNPGEPGAEGITQGPVVITHVFDGPRRRPQPKPTAMQAELDEMRSRVRKIEVLAIPEVEKHIDIVEIRTYDRMAENNILFSWDGNQNSVSWSNGRVRAKNGDVFPVKAGSRILVPNTWYWFGWNAFHEFMVVDRVLGVVAGNDNNIVLIGFQTGDTAAQVTVTSTPPEPSDPTNPTSDPIPSGGGDPSGGGGGGYGGGGGGTRRIVF